MTIPAENAKWTIIPGSKKDQTSSDKIKEKLTSFLEAIAGTDVRFDYKSQIRGNHGEPPNYIFHTGRPNQLIPAVPLNIPKNIEDTVLFLMSGLRTKYTYKVLPSRMNNVLSIYFHQVPGP